MHVHVTRHTRECVVLTFTLTLRDHAGFRFSSRLHFDHRELSARREKTKARKRCVPEFPYHPQPMECINSWASATAH